MASFSIKAVDGLVAIEFDGEDKRMVFYAERVVSDPKDLKKKGA